MKNTKKAGNLIEVVVAVFILGITLLGIIHIISFNQDINYNYRQVITSHILEGNANNVLKKINVDTLEHDEEFYLYKDTILKQFKALTGSSNESYKYVNTVGKKTEKTLETIGELYEQTFTKKVDILRHHIKPSEIPDLIFHFDATNINNNNNTGISNNDTIEKLHDLSGNNLNFIQPSSSKRATFNTNQINTYPALSFDGINDIYVLDGNNNNVLDSDGTVNGHTYYYDGVSPLVNKNHEVCSWTEPLVFKEKSLAIVLKTGSDVNSDQMIYEQGGVSVGYNFTIANGNIYAGIHNKGSGIEGCYNYDNYTWSGGDVRSVDLGEALPNSIYYIMVVHDASNTNTSLNSLKIYLNGELADSQFNVEPMPRHHKIGLGGIIGSNIEPYGSFDTHSCPGGDGSYDGCRFFKGDLGEFIMWNYAMSENQVRGVQQYFLEKWVKNQETIQYDIVNTSIKKVQ